MLASGTNVSASLSPSPTLTLTRLVRVHVLASGLPVVSDLFQDAILALCIELFLSRTRRLRAGGRAGASQTRAIWIDEREHRSADEPGLA